MHIQPILSYPIHPSRAREDACFPLLPFFSRICECDEKMTCLPVPAKSERKELQKWMKDPEHIMCAKEIWVTHADRFVLSCISIYRIFMAFFNFTRGVDAIMHIS